MADVEFIRLLFKPRIQEDVAHRWATRLARLLGPSVRHLRPDTTLSELLEWAARRGADSMDFVVVFETELGMEFAEFLDCSDHVTFRDMVTQYAGRFDESKENH